MFKYKILHYEERVMIMFNNREHLKITFNFKEVENNDFSPN